MLFHAPVERRPCQAEFTRGPRNVESVFAQRLEDRFFLQVIEIENGRNGLSRRQCRFPSCLTRIVELQVLRLNFLMWGKNDGTLDGVAEGAHIAWPWIVAKRIFSCLGE